MSILGIFLWKLSQIYPKIFPFYVNKIFNFFCQFHPFSNMQNIFEDGFDPPPPPLKKKKKKKILGGGGASLTMMINKKNTLIKTNIYCKNKQKWVLKYSFHCEVDDHNHDCDVHQFSLSSSMNEKAQRLSSNGLIYDAVLCGKNDNDDIWFGYNMRVLISNHIIITAIFITMFIKSLIIIIIIITTIVNNIIIRFSAHHPILSSHWQLRIKNVSKRYFPR